MTSRFEDSSLGKFCARQFAVEPTRWQLMFDFCVGVLVPAVCLLRDPVVFHASHEREMLGEYRVVGLIAIGIGIGEDIEWRITVRGD